jgi:hypothetical protein
MIVALEIVATFVLLAVAGAAAMAGAFAPMANDSPYSNPATGYWIMGGAGLALIVSLGGIALVWLK